MTALILDGFDHYGSSPSINAFPLSNMLDGSWASIDSHFSVTTPTWGSARTGTGCLKYNSHANTLDEIARRVLPSGKTHLFISFGFSVDSLPSGSINNAIIDFRNNSNVALFTLGVDTTGAVFIGSGHLLDNPTPISIIAETSIPVVKAQTWHFFELEIDTTGGVFKLRVDDATGTGSPVINTAISTGAGIYQLGFGHYNSGGVGGINLHWDDLFIRDSSGTVNNGFLGDRRIATLYTNSDTATAGWVPSFYQRFGSGILTLGYVIPNNNTVQNSSAYVSTPGSTDFDIGSSDFTIETQVRFDAQPTSDSYSSIFSRWDANNNRRSYRLILGSSGYNNNCLQFDTTTDGTSSTLQTPILYPWVPVLNRWYHIAIVRVSGQLLLFVDGQQFGLPINDSRTYYGGGSEVFSLGSEVTGTGSGSQVANTGLAGRLDETRFTNGYGRYTGPFSPPVAAFPRGSGGDAHWSQVVLISGYDSGVVDESSFAHTLNARNGAVSFVPNDGPSVGSYSTTNKATPDDNTFISAALVNATNILTMTTQPTAGDTVTVGTKNGSTAAVYTFRAGVSSAFDVLIDTTAQNTLINLFNAINAGPGAGTKYGTGTTSNFDVNAVQLPVGQIQVVANTAGTAGNSIASTKTGSAASWASATLTGGANIPGPTNFKFQHPPPNTTIISALQTVIRAAKTDSGLGTVQTALIGPLGGTITGSAHPLAVSVDYYTDIIETDPDTSGSLTPTTIINGQFQINRTA